MPQLNTTTWPTIITPMLLALFLITQLKLLNSHLHPPTPPKPTKPKPHAKPWGLKWTKVYLPHSLPPQY
uniref:ATP synthase complex subunit 8 n=1 Tax=Pongo abelii TaxID=9601 RepID=A0A0X8E9C6_PONAB|nr:ATP synthase F0 subunit 8 [Pongo abelii]